MSYTLQRGSWLRNAFFLPAFLLAVLNSQNLIAQNYSVDWYTIDDGGGTSSGGTFSLTGTIGQPDASVLPMTNVQYSVTGGFWALPIAVQVTNAPLLTITPAGPGLATISWAPNTPGFVLQYSPTMMPANWQDAASGSQNPVTVPATVPAGFYRLFKP